MALFSLYHQAFMYSHAHQYDWIVQLIIIRLLLFLCAGHTWAHHCCAAWSEGVIQSEDYYLLYVDKAVVSGLAQVRIHVKHQSLSNVLYSFFLYST